MFNTTPYSVKSSVPPSEHHKFTVDWITDKKLMLLTVGSRNNTQCINEVTVPDTRQMEIYRSIDGFTVAVIRYAEPLVAIYMVIKTPHQLVTFLGDSQQSREILETLGMRGKPRELFIHIPTKSLPDFHKLYDYKECLY